MFFNGMFSKDKLVMTYMLQIKLFSNIILHSVSNESEVYLEPSQVSRYCMRDLFFKNSAYKPTADDSLGCKYTSLNITLHLTFLEKHGLRKVYEICLLYLLSL